MAELSRAQQEHMVIGNTTDSSKSFQSTTHPDAQWFLQGGNMGLFIHWGISTVTGEGDLSWGMINNKPYETKEGKNFVIPPSKYWGLAKDFHPEHFQPEELMSAIADAGFTYAVFTTRHHDGYALWPSEYGDFSTKQYMNGRDLVREYIDACRKFNIKVGLYYSPPDWHIHRDYLSYEYASFGNSRKHSGAPLLDMDLKPVDSIPDEPADLEEKYMAYVNGQIRELIHNYGKIDLLWFDGSVDDVSRAVSIEEIRAAQPGIVINDRLHHTGDYNSQFECRLPDEKPEGPWEHCHIWPENCGWAYCSRMTGYRPAQWVYDSYEKVCGWHGNMLINVGPKGDGSLPAGFYEELAKLKVLLQKR